MSATSLPHNIYSGAFKTPHCQGIAIDTERKYLYFSYTTMLVKTDLSGKLIGSCGGLTGHLGCIDFNDDDGKVYGSLEYKAKKAFYCATFDVDKIDRPGLSAEEDGIMKTVYLPDVVEDFCEVMDGSGVFDGDTADTPDHRYAAWHRRHRIRPVFEKLRFTENADDSIRHLPQQQLRRQRLSDNRSI